MEGRERKPWMATCLPGERAIRCFDVRGSMSFLSVDGAGPVSNFHHPPPYRQVPVVVIPEVIHNVINILRNLCLLYVIHRSPFIGLDVFLGRPIP
jgi:hypothetical protein